jgi:hypothetical protein
MLLSRFKSSPHIKNTQLGRLLSAPGQAQVEALPLHRKSGRPRARDRGNTRQHSVVVGIPLFDNVNEAFPAGDINALTYRIIKEIVGIPVRINLRYRLARSGIQHHQLRTMARPDE